MSQFQISLQVLDVALLLVHLRLQDVDPLLIKVLVVIHLILDSKILVDLVDIALLVLHLLLQFAVLSLQFHQSRVPILFLKT